MTIQKFEDLFSWQRARELSRRIYDITKQKPFCFDRGLVSQIQRAAVSVMANQAEGFSRGTRTELINYFFIAKGSAGEVQSHLYTASDAGYIDMSTFRNVYGLADETQRLIQSFVLSVKEGSKSGIQHKRPGMEKLQKIRELQELAEQKRAAGEDATEVYKEIFRLEGIKI